MGMTLPGRFREVWLCDFEYEAPVGGSPLPVCAVFKELNSGQTLRLWQDELQLLPVAPITTSADGLFVSYFASAELGCFLALGWPP